MPPINKPLARFEARWNLLFSRLSRAIHKRLFSCSSPNCFDQYQKRKLSHPAKFDTVEDAPNVEVAIESKCSNVEVDQDMLALKISLLGDCGIGKTSFATKYVGEEKENKEVKMEELNLMDKIFTTKGGKIAFRIWDIVGDDQHLDDVPIACKDAVSVLIMFDLTNRQSLNNVVSWYHRARRWNKKAIPILVGTKFDEFVQLPFEMQWTISNQARTYARAMDSPLFFSSASHNINVNKIFKFIVAKLFNLKWTVERNLTIGEPIIDF
ncbi:septum-promoting GTP-binding protein 1-like [Zingiber officinale]|uniref:septum-promoting GTP-binding protein 1-like n=1 Tax=Zingiber officinale TaxID=94328 RepID=UPI001C4D17B9|nr:septum-promoting GTP-binding protein 1-like [Zingiber officinale]